jgi:transcriptional regulator with GAF, ATPase, and Fis domain
MAIFPLFASGHFLGAVSFGTIRREGEWPPEVVRRLRLVAEMFASAFLKRNREDELRAALAETRELKERSEAKNLVLRDEMGSNPDFEEIVGESLPLRHVLDQASLVAGTDSTLLLLGETGSGKCVVARTVHRHSRRCESPLIHVNCAALPATLIESELFGHEKGAFSGALQRRFGRFELADGGTIFLDEIGELSDQIQAKLLRVLESGEFERVGSSATQRVDVRVIAATNRDLPHAVAEGRFRDDLYYRLRVFPIEVPPLRERREDIPLLAAYFLEKQRGRLNKSIDHVPARTMEQLKAYAWPGNVRELENVIERAMIMSPGSALVLDGVLGGGLVPGAPPSIPATEETPPTRTLEAVERDYIRQACERCGWRIGGKGSASELLGLNPSTLRSRMKKLGISRPQGGIGFGT